jgi:transcription-repair coupling factor (superfamily II helicase)
LCNLKEIKDTLRIAFENINSVDEAIEVLEMVL